MAYRARPTLRRAFGLMVAVIGLLVMWAPGAGAQVTTPSTLTVDQSSYQPDDTVTFTGTGFLCEGVVGLRLLPPGIQIGIISADETGTFTGTFPAPSVSGTYTLTATNDLCSARTSFAVQGGTDSLTTLTVDQSKYQPGDMVTFTGTGFLCEGNVGLRLFPPGLEIAIVSADDTGTFQGSFPAPSRSGTYQLTATNDLCSATTSFTVQGGTDRLTTLTVNQSKYAPGDIVTFTGTGYVCEGNVGVRLIPPGLLIAVMSADDTGTFQGSFPAPSRSGTYTLTATNDLCSARTTFTVEGGTDNLTTLTVDQSSYQPGETVTFTGTGFVCEGNVGLRLFPPGLQFAIVNADDAGTFQGSFPAPSVSGTYQLTATNDLCTARTSFTVKGGTDSLTTLTVDQSSYQPGETVTFTGTGFVCEGNVGLRIFPSALQIGIVSADDTGTFQGTFAAPSRDGTYTLTATNDLCSARTSFRVQGGTTRLSTLTVDQSSYGPGETVTFTGTGFVCEGNVGLRLIPPGLQIGIISADDTGTFQGSFPAPSVSGTYQLTATNDLCSARTSFTVQGGTENLSTLTVDQPSYQPGDTVTFTGTGFVCEGNVGLRLIPPGIQFLVFPDDTGTFTGTFPAPSWSGTYTLTATNDLCSARTSFRVNSGNASDP